MHAVLYIGTYDAVLPQLPEAAQKGNDVHHVRGGLCTVDDAARLCAHAARAPLQSTTHIVVAYDRYMPQAQNMLLKSLEDAVHVQWYFIAPRRDTLLPTVRSRLSEVAGVASSAVRAEAEAFLALTYQGRLAYLATRYAKAAKTDEEKAITHRLAQDIVTACEARAHCDPIKYAQLARDTRFVRTYLDQPGASGKMLLELLALSA